MYWMLETEAVEEAAEQRDTLYAGRFVLHRHTDVMGEHLDLRLETDEALRGWRIDATELGDAMWATEKRAHPKRWLDDPADATTMDAGRYTVEAEEPGDVVLVLEGRQEIRRLRARRVEPIPASALGAVVNALKEAGAGIGEASALVLDGAAARTRAIGRLCGLGRELDGTAFDETIWRKTLRSLSLEEIHAQLRAFEVRFDQRYPAAPVSRPDRIEPESGDRDAQALAILRA